MGKRKKEKVAYIDDGRTVADMSGVKRGFRISSRNTGGRRLNPKEVWNTYWSAVKMMFGPMLVVVCAIIIIYMLLSLIFLLI